ncbi:UTRA domain-containing protein [Burkholderia ubonensis]|uniref:UTRA domain-containing protein n=1 Tax=Burkholderia ubonensis TaxID=101571 RepID=UPI001E58954B|nr:GntR family transcriptional regulator [Burkholderia ubonensis]
MSRDTVRRAIDKLTRQGLIESRRGLHPGSQWLRRELDRPSPDELLALGLAPDARAIRLERVRTADAAPMAIERATLPANLLSAARSRATDARSN